jgi:hypothetical protein
VLRRQPGRQGPWGSFFRKSLPGAWHAGPHAQIFPKSPMVPWVRFSRGAQAHRAGRDATWVRFSRARGAVAPEAVGFVFPGATRWALRRGRRRSTLPRAPIIPLGSFFQKNNTKPFQSERALGSFFPGHDPRVSARGGCLGSFFRDPLRVSTPRPRPLVPTLRVGMPSSTLRVGSSAGRGPGDAERPGRHSHGGPWERVDNSVLFQSERTLGSFFPGHNPPGAGARGLVELVFSRAPPVIAFRRPVTSHQPPTTRRPWVRFSRARGGPNARDARPRAVPAVRAHPSF